MWRPGHDRGAPDQALHAPTGSRDARGKVEPSNVFKKSPDFEGTLRSIKKGAQVRWRRNLCANCNNAKSQSFDLACAVFEAFLVERG